MSAARSHTILLGIDGTGPMFTTSYHETMQASFVRYILRHAETKTKKYMRGPGFDGFDMPTIGHEGYEFVHLCKAANPDARVLLTGYSRGGAGVIDVACRLAEDEVKVDGMVLFDAVDRAPYPGVVFSGYDIPTNVLRVAHAKRDPHNFSRNSFSNCATDWHAPTHYETQTFWATHGALGGVPSKPTPNEHGPFIDEGVPEVTPTFVTHDQDRAGARLVWAWAEPKLRSMGFF